MAEEADSEQPREDNVRKKAPDENSASQVPQLLLTTATIISHNSHDSDSDSSNISISVTDNDHDQVTLTGGTKSNNQQASHTHLVSTSLRVDPTNSRSHFETVAIMPEPRRLSFSPHDHHLSPVPSRDVQDLSPSLSVSTHSSPPTMLFSEVMAGVDSNGMIMSSSLSGKWC